MNRSAWLRALSAALSATFAATALATSPGTLSTLPDPIENIDSITRGLAPKTVQHDSPVRAKEVQQALEVWRLSWELGDADLYLRFYDPEFKGDAGSRKAWEQQRRARLANAKINVKVEKPQTTLVSDTEAEIRFVQHYRSAQHQDVGEKVLKMRRTGGAWKITSESWTPAAR